MANEDDILAEAERTVLDLAMPLFNRHLAEVRRSMELSQRGYPECRGVAMLHWASLQTVFGAHPDAKAVLDAMLPEIKALPSGPVRGHVPPG